MTPPDLAAQRLLMALVLGLILGLCYGFLRPLRRIGNWLRDLLFLICLFWAWLILGFGICGGDLRLGYFSGLFLGGFLWEKTVGKLLRPVFFGFWGAIFHLLSIFLRLFKNIFQKLDSFAKKHLHLKKNRVQ